MSQPSRASDDHEKRPRQECDEKNRDIKPEWLDVLEFGGEVALEIVFDDENSEKVGIAAGAEDVPRNGYQAERSDRGGMKQAESVAPALRENCPKEDCAAEKNDCYGAFC